jgi:hypothetical protein
LRVLRLEPVVVGDLHAGDVLEHEDLLGDVGVDHRRDEELVVVGDDLGDPLGMVSLLAEVELAAEVHLQLLRERSELQEARRLRPPLCDRSRLAQQREVDLDLLHDAGAPHLHDHLPAGLQQRLVDLRDRRGREGLAVDPGEVVEADLGRDHRLDLVERNGRHLVDELPELVDVDVRQQVGT